MNKNKNRMIPQEDQRLGTLTKKDRRSMYRRWIFTAGLGYNYETQQAPSVAFSMAKALRKIYKNEDDYVKAMDNHFKFFNVTPHMGNIILGATLAMEEKDGLKAYDAVQNLKASLMGPLSGVGDALIWVLLPTVFGSIAGYMALQGNPTGALIWIFINFLLYFAKMGLFELGYQSGTKLITTMSEKINIFTDAISVLGLMVIGTLIATSIKISTPLTFTTGDVTMELQADILDKIMPKLLSVFLVAFVYWLMGKKKWSPTKIIFLIIGISIFGSVAGILG
ncbi:PTS system mannose-specific EIID component [uncultured Clostridium sp.]|nr:PTS system mannose-specific EIID component [uncultured Clostridium sp.]